MQTSTQKMLKACREMLIPQRTNKRQMLCDAGITLGILLLASVVCALLTHVGDSDSAVPMVFVLAVLLIARLTNGFLFSLVASIVSVIGVNYAFTYPYLEFNFTITGYPLTFVTMFAVSFVVGMLTERVKRQERIKAEAETEKMKANLLRSVSHDLRTPLTSISGNASNLLSNAETLDAETRTKICTDIFDDAQWLIGLVENLLSITRIEDGRMNLQISPQLMDEVVEETLRHISRKSKEHIITTTYSDEILLADMDARLIMQVIINLVDNAIKYTQKGSRINISAYAKNSNIVVDVSDDGPGIPEQNKAQVFEMFFTGQNQIADSHRSLGLGLALCRTILAAHKGTLTLRDNEPHGCIFSFELPKSEVSIHE